MALAVAGCRRLPVRKQDALCCPDFPPPREIRDSDRTFCSAKIRDNINLRERGDNGEQGIKNIAKRGIKIPKIFRLFAARNKARRCFAPDSVAQLVEQMTLNHWVESSNLSGVTRLDKSKFFEFVQSFLFRNFLLT